MGFLDKLRGKPKLEEKQILLKDVDSFLESRVSKKRSELDKAVASKFSEIKHLLKQTNALLSRLETKSVESENPKLKKIVQTSKAQALNQLSSLVQRLEPVSLNDLSAVQKYCYESNAMLKTELASFGKNIAYTSIVLKEDMREIGSLVSDLQNVFSSLGKEFSKNKEVFMQSRVREMLEKISSNGKEISDLNSEISELQGSVLEAEKLIDSLHSDLKRIRTSPEAQSLLELEAQRKALLTEKQALEQEIFDRVFVIEKPLRKLYRLVEIGKTGLSKSQENFLRDFLKSPVSALKSDPRGDYFKAVLQELENHIVNGNIGLKEKEVEKKKALLQGLLNFDFFENFFWKANKFETDLNKIDKDLKSNELAGRISKKERELNDAKLVLQERGSSLNKKKKSLEAVQEGNQMLLDSLQNILSESVSAKVKIV
ncbi:MAG: hypothetical protein JW772_03235 [Candidatus Diapherotrites archaeon]|nr:hypothetical protein [Candidatus Diapherotrites archaeon]